MKHILIDNDKLIHLGWKSKAKKEGVELYTFLSIQDFQQEILNFDFDSIIYVDSDLGGGIKGEIEAKKLFEAGFKNLYLTTGYTDIDVNLYPWIRGIVSKRPSFK